MADDFATRFSEGKSPSFEERFMAGVKDATAAPEKKKATPERIGPPTALDVILNPEGIPQHMISLAATAALTGGAGTLAKSGAVKLGLPELAVKVAPAIGRIAASGGLGAAEAFNRGADLSGAERSAFVNAIIAGLTEGVLGSASGLSKAEREVVKANKRGADQAATAEARAAEQTAASSARAREATTKESIKAEVKNKELQKAFEWAKAQPEKAIEAVAPGIKWGAWLHVPSLSERPLLLSEIPDLLKQKRGVDYAEARQQIIGELNRLSGTGARADLPAAGTSFERRTSSRLFEPESVEPRPTAVRRRIVEPAKTFTPEPMPKTLRGYMTRENAPRAAADALLTQPSIGGQPVGLVGGVLSADYLPELARRALTGILPR